VDRDAAGAAQVGRIPGNASHAVVSIGGNDALQHSDLLSLSVRSSAEALGAFAERLETFEGAYRRAVDAVIAAGLPTTVCTVYNGALEPRQAVIARVGLAMFNDVILRTAFERRLDVVELRTICAAPEDYANPIEPSGEGGRKIARAIAQAVGAIDGADPRSRVLARP
jgi:hypothetical protein